MLNTRKNKLDHKSHLIGMEGYIFTMSMEPFGTDQCKYLPVYFNGIKHCMFESIPVTAQMSDQSFGQINCRIVLS